MEKSVVLLLVLGGIVRYYLQSFHSIGERVEVSTPINSFKRVQEGIYLYENGIDPYAGDVVHELPVVLVLLVRIFGSVSNFMPLLYNVLDLLTATLLYKMAKKFVSSKLLEQREQKFEFARDTEELQFQKSDMDVVPRCVLLAYLFNPLSLLSCAGLTSTVFSNFLLALTLYFLVHRYLLPCICCLALETMRNLYPLVLIAPVVLVFTQRSKAPTSSAIGVVALFGAACFAITGVNYALMQSWNFLDATLGFIFFYRDLQPNIGLFWYFFTEMFEHFRTMFLITFQMNATVLYLVPLSLKLRKEPLLLATVLIALMSIFRSYPSVGDVSFYLALLPLWRRCWKFMAHNFVVFCFFVVTLSMMPALWQLWIYSGSANANFYFGTTLAFSTGQIFLVTDLLFAHVKRDFCLRNGLKIYVDGKEAKIILE
ncbi:PREDICTED: phosphatidylinositol glycan anchor biosynthesis class U protein [Rhagoletis zephyria]|uniref:phosphatidylinositol glycan anchor biosynthesis class U protein n=1 Tax=Rhagoletis zephyria TaxID=28612 RepID=UPI0008114E0C|nr:PREDICTED: phosphatidylinositol glycan anchor biosynthesis class U protein [Rhagoletis zephyria]